MKLTLHRPAGRPAIRWLVSVEEDLYADNGRYKLKTKLPGSGPMESNRKRGLGSAWISEHL
jgi:hypothetical protein